MWLKELLSLNNEEVFSETSAFDSTTTFEQKARFRFNTHTEMWYNDPMPYSSDDFDISSMIPTTRFEEVIKYSTDVYLIFFTWELVSPWNFRY